ncbi:MAG: hypothetical protein WBI14_05980 [Anaerolineaceae bacterium]
MEEVILIPTTARPFSMGTDLDRLILAEQVERHLSDDSEVSSRIILSHPAAVFIEGDIKHPVQTVVYASMAALG